MSGVLHPKLQLLVALARKVDHREDDDAVVDAAEVGFDDAPTRTIDLSASAPRDREDVSNDNVDAAGVDREVDDDDEIVEADDGIAEIDEPERERDNVHAWRRERLPRMQH